MLRQLSRSVLTILILAFGGAPWTARYAVANDDIHALNEFGAARSDHAAIALALGQCYYKEFGDPINWSPTVRIILHFELDEHFLMPPGLPYIQPVKVELLPNPPVLNAFHEAAISFSDRVSRDRLAFRKELEDSRARSRLYQLLILGLGTSATIFISIRSVLQGSTVVSGTVGVLAIVLSAAGAAVSSMNTFEGSQAIALRDQRALSQLQQLHWRIASDVLKRPELCSEPTKTPAEAMKVVDAWRSRLETILDSAVESISKPGDISSGSATEDGGKPQPPKGDSRVAIPAGNSDG